jgi:hypothetical protein
MNERKFLKAAWDALSVASKLGGVQLSAGRVITMGEKWRFNGSAFAPITGLGIDCFGHLPTCSCPIRTVLFAKW